MKYFNRCSQTTLGGTWDENAPHWTEYVYWAPLKSPSSSSTRDATQGFGFVPRCVVAQSSQHWVRKPTSLQAPPPTQPNNFTHIVKLPAFLTAHPGLESSCPPIRVRFFWGGCPGFGHWLEVPPLTSTVASPVEPPSEVVLEQHSTLETLVQTTHTHSSDPRTSLRTIGETKIQCPLSYTPRKWAPL